MHYIASHAYIVIDSGVQFGRRAAPRRAPEFEMLTPVRGLRFWLAVLLVASAPLVACVAPPDDVETKEGAAVDICATAPEGALCD